MRLIIFPHPANEGATGIDCAQPGGVIKMPACAVATVKKCRFIGETDATAAFAAGGAGEGM